MFNRRCWWYIDSDAIEFENSKRLGGDRAQTLIP